MAFTRNAIAVNNIQGQPDQPIISATALKTLFDKTGSDEKTYNNDVLLVELEAPTSASSLGQNNGSYGATIQSAIDTITSAGVGTIPPDGTITNLKLATDVKIGSLESLSTTDKSSVVSAVNEVITTTVPKTQFTKYVSATQLDKSDATLADIPNLAFPVVAGKTYKIETFAKYQTGATTTGIKFYSYLPTGAGTIIGNNHVYFNTTVSGSADVLIGVTVIGASGLTGSGITTPSVGEINVDLYLYSNLVFKCTSSGEFRQQFASEVAAIARLMAGATMLVSEV